MNRFDCIGKTVTSVEHLEHEGWCDRCKITFTDGSTLIITAQWCNDDTAALEYEEVKSI